LSEGISQSNKKMYDMGGYIILELKRLKLKQGRDIFKILIDMKIGGNQDPLHEL
jgi:hypothetical protein